MSPLISSIIYTSSRNRLLFNSTSFHLFRFFSSSPSRSGPLELSLSHPIYMVWGSNTGVGKTLVSAGIADSVLSSSSSSSSSLFTEPVKFKYVKPVQTGFPVDSDSRFVHRKLSEICTRRRLPVDLFSSNRVLRASNPGAKQVVYREAEDKDKLVDRRGNLCWYEERTVLGEKSRSVACELECVTMFAWKEAISPHLAVEREGRGVDDSMLLDSLQRCLRFGCGNGDDKVRLADLTVIETAGGVASPGPSGTLQCDIYSMSSK